MDLDWAREIFIEAVNCTESDNEISEIVDSAEKLKINKKDIIKHIKVN